MTEPENIVWNKCEAEMKISVKNIESVTKQGQRMSYRFTMVKEVDSHVQKVLTFFKIRNTT